MDRLLIVRMGALGDIVHTLPAVASLHRAFPRAEIDWVVEKHWAPLLERNSQIAHLHLVETREWRRSLGESGTWRSLFDLMGVLRGRRYDCALDFQGLIKSAALARLSGARAVLGFDRPELREDASGLLYTRRVPVARNGRPLHVVGRNLALAAAAGARVPVMEFLCAPGPADSARMRNATAGARDFIMVCPSAGWGAKRWPQQSWSELISQISRHTGRGLVVNAGPGEETAAQHIADAAAAPVLILKPTLGELIALAGAARLVIGGDTGPVHLAAALGTPVVAIFGPTDPARNGPVGAPCRVVRSAGAETTYARDADQQAIRGVTVDAVLEAALALLATNTARE